MAFIERMNALEEENEKLRQVAGPRSGVMTVDVPSLADWDPYRRLDDEAGVAKIRSSLRRPAADEDDDSDQP